MGYKREWLENSVSFDETQKSETSRAESRRTFTNLNSKLDTHSEFLRPSKISELSVTRFDLLNKLPTEDARLTFPI